MVKKSLSYSNLSISPGCDTPASQSPQSMIPHQVNFPGVSYPSESIKNPPKQGIIPNTHYPVFILGVSYLGNSVFLTYNLNSSAKIFNPLVSGPGRYVQIMKKWRPKILLDWPFNGLEINIFFKDLLCMCTCSPPRPRDFNTLFIQYYSVICRPSVHTVGRPQAEIRTQDGQSRGRENSIQFNSMQLYLVNITVHTYDYCTTID